MIKAVLLLAAAALAACAKPAPPARVCPAVPECRRPQAVISTNADLARAYLAADAALARAYLAADAALAECKLARDTLAACVFHQEKDAP